MSPVTWAIEQLFNYSTHGRKSRDTAHKDRRFYNPSDQGYEAKVKERVEQWRDAGED